jgi:transposase InsO family protein
MSGKPPSARAIAFWRYQQIEDVLAEPLSRRERARLLVEKSRTPVCWPSGETRPVSLPSLYRWLAAYRRRGLEGLQPAPRRDRGRQRQRLPEAVIAEALRLLTEDPGLSFTLLIEVLRATFQPLAVPRSTLQRRLAAHPTYQHLRRVAGHRRRRTRFVARAPHEIWQCDAKGPVRVTLGAGELVIFHVLSILDDATRAVLAALVVLTVDLAAAVRVFRAAALRWGLPRRLYADRASIFDSVAFRTGLAGLGAHRIRSKPRNAPARGKIEAYHRVLARWFTDRLAHQKVIDLEHLQQLLNGVIALYQRHRHRGLEATPEQALGGRRSARAVPPTRLFDAFREEKRLKAHPVTGEVEIGSTTYLVPEELRGQTLTFLIDPPGEIEPLVVHRHSGEVLTLRKAAIRSEDLPQPAAAAPVERWAAGPLQMLHDAWRGQVRPLAEPGFGLPELYALLARLCVRHVPDTDAEAAEVQRVYHQHGPWSRAATEAAIASIASQLGAGRPLRTYLEALIRRLESPRRS